MRYALACAAVMAAGCSVLADAVPSDSAVAPADAAQEAALPYDAAPDAPDAAPADAGGGSSGEGATGGPGGTGGHSGEGGSGGVGGTGGTGGGSGSGGTGPVCECSTVSECCDGCEFTHACDAVRSEPQCQAATCDDAFGCSVTNARELLPCNDGDPDTRNDSCRSGVCVGDRRVCSSGPCCDGWDFLSEAVRCAAPAPFTNGQPNPVGLGGEVYECRATTACGRSIMIYPVDVYCSGDSAECDGRHGDHYENWSTSTSCGVGFRCEPGSSAYTKAALCIPAPGC